MEITIQHRPAGYDLVRLQGELRRESGELISQRLHPLIAPRKTAVIVDLSGVTLIDSSGLSHLISLATHARLSESKFVLFDPTPFVAGVLELTHLDKWFDLADDLAGAEARLQTSTQ